jgi:hypothetical protein
MFKNIFSLSLDLILFLRLRSPTSTQIYSAFFRKYSFQKSVENTLTFIPKWRAYMLNFLTKTTPLLVASLLATTVGFAQDSSRAQKKGFDQGLEMPMSQTLAAHSYPARKEVRGSWDVNGTMSYILWQAMQENMDVGLLSNAALPPSTSDLISSVSSLKHANFDFKSGFKAGLGVNLDYDNWNVSSEYTWFHGTTHTAVAAVTGQFIYPSRSIEIIDAAFIPFASANQSWNLKMDLVDLSLSRSYYSGTKFTLNPFFGVRGAWIRQTINSNYYRNTSETEALTVHANTVSQGVGPRTGLDSNWLLGYGLRLTGKASGDILYTRYHYTFQQKAFQHASTDVSDKHTDFLRAHTDLALGLGWGSYFDNNNWYVDLSAEYGFQVFWNQNMFRSYGATFGQTSEPNGNLFVHGLNITARLDF